MDYEKNKDKIKEIEDMLWLAYPFMQVRARTDELWQKYSNVVEENKALQNELYFLRERLDSQQAIIADLQRQLEKFDKYVKAGEKIENLEKDFD